MCSSVSLSIEGVWCDLVQTRWFRFSLRRVARVRTGDLTFIRAMRCLVEACLQTL